jgi:nitrate reductase delta subunit
MTTTMVRQSTAEALALVSLLLRYPTDELVAGLPELQTAVAVLPTHQQRPLQRFLGHLRDTPLTDAQRDYVATFDLKRKCCLYLSYYLNGDTRRRGMALVGFHEVYRQAGVTVSVSELPDYLPIVLEFTATVDPDAGLQLLWVHRSGLAVLRLALTGLGSPYADLIHVVADAVPIDHDAASDDVTALTLQGPPTELVGLEPFGPPELTGRGARS